MKPKRSLELRNCVDDWIRAHVQSPACESRRGPRPAALNVSSNHLRPHGLNRTPEEVAAYISNALNGTDGEETWEDFEQTIVSDARLESIRKQAIAVKWPLDKVGRDKFEGLLLQLKKLAMTEASPTALEMAVLRDLCRRLPPQDRAALEEQIIGISVLNRRNTGAGFFTYFILTEKSSNRITVDVKGYPTRANIDDTENALGFILWLKNGYVDYLEGYTEALDSTHGMDLAALKFEINGH